MIIKIVGASLILIAIATAFRRWEVLKSCVLTEGKVAELVPKTDGEGTTYGLKVEFQTRNGQLRFVQSTSSQWPQSYKVGDKIRVYFDPNDPKKLGLASFGHYFGVQWIIFIIGILLLGYPIGNVLLEKFLPIR
jgi:hypothetical protein